MYQAHAHELLNQKDGFEDMGLAEGEGPLAQAAERLRAALDKLEDRLAESAQTQHVNGEESEKLRLFEQENAHLREERDELTGTIDELKSQYADLHKSASTIYNKLNDSIKRLTQIIGD